MIGDWSVLISCTLLSSAQQLPEYPGTVLTKIGDELLVDRAPQQFGYFVTRDSVDTVAEHFYRKWVAEGQVTLVDGDFEQGLIVSAFSTLEALQRSVILRRQGRTTIGFSVLRALRFERPSPAVRAKVEGEFFVHGAISRERTPSSSHRTVLLHSGLAQARRILVEQLNASGCTGIREQSPVIESHCPEGEVRTLLVEQSQDLTAVLHTVIGDRVQCTTSNVVGCTHNVSPEGEAR